MGEDLVIGDEKLIAKFRDLREAVQGKTLVNIALAGGTVVVNAAKGNIQEQGLMRTRHLSTHIDQGVVESTQERAVVEIGTNVEYAAIHEFGGTITAKKGKYLAIPVGTRRGSPSKHSDLRLRKTAGGNLVMVDGAGVVQYLLKTSVVIPARPWLRPAADETHSEVSQTMSTAFAKAVNQAAGG